MDIKDFEPLFGDWTIDSFIGAGSFGKVYRIKREEFGAVYFSALKWISIPQDDTELKQLRYDGMDNESISEYYTNVVKDLTNELQLMSRLRGRSSIVSYEDHRIISKPDRMGYDILIRMELLTSLNDYMLSHALSRAELIRLGINICEALELCQRYNIIHRDIKPDNVFVTEIGDFKLGDFGIARQLEETMSGLSKKGTYNYMAPEVYKGERYSSNVDIYSLGIMIYRLLNDGRLPFLPMTPAVIRPSDRDQSLFRRMSGEAMPPPRNAEGRLGEIILKACAYDPKDRYSSPKQMRDELLAIQFTQEEARIVFHDEDDLGNIEPSTRRTDVGQTVLEPEATESAFGLLPEFHSPETLDIEESSKASEEDDNDNNNSKIRREAKARIIRAVMAVAIGGLAIICACLYGHVVKVKLIVTSHEMEVGNTQELQVNVTRFLKGTQNEVVQLIYDEEVLSIDDDGIVTAVGEGEIEIQACIDNVRAYCNINSQYPTITLGTTNFKTNVTELNLSGQGITDISPLAACFCLVKLDLSWNPITSIDTLEYVYTLENLNISGTKVVNLQPLSSLQKLKYVNILYTLVSDISSLDNGTYVHMNMKLERSINLVFGSTYSVNEADFGIKLGAREITWTSSDPAIGWYENGNIRTTGTQNDISKSWLRATLYGSIENSSAILKYEIFIPCEQYSVGQAYITYLADKRQDFFSVAVTPKVENCYGFTFTLPNSMIECLPRPYYFDIYLWNDDGWVNVATTYMTNVSDDSTTITFDSPISFKGIGVSPNDSKSNTLVWDPTYLELLNIVFEKR